MAPSHEKTIFIRTQIKTIMKTMTCEELGGACTTEFHANTFEEIAEQSKKHGMEMLKSGDHAHRESMRVMQELMETPSDMTEWFENKRMEFEELPED